MAGPTSRPNGRSARASSRPAGGASPACAPPRWCGAPAARAGCGWRRGGHGGSTRRCAQSVGRRVAVGPARRGPSSSAGRPRRDGRRVRGRSSIDEPAVPVRAARPRRRRVATTTRTGPWSDSSTGWFTKSTVVGHRDDAMLLLCGTHGRLDRTRASSGRPAGARAHFNDRLLLALKGTMSVPECAGPPRRAAGSRPAPAPTLAADDALLGSC